MKNAIKVTGNNEGLYSPKAYEELRLQLSTGDFHTHKALPVKVSNKTPIQIHPSEYTVTEIHGIKFIGRSEYGELHAINDNGGFEHYDLTYGDNTADGNSYVSCCGSGYSPRSLVPLSKKDIENIEGAYTSDGLCSCEECGLMYDTDSYESNPGYIVAGECSFVCREGCFVEWLKRHGVEDYVNKADRCIPLEATKSLVKSKQIKFVRRYIGGMTDAGRGGSFNGEHVENGQPKQVLRELLEEDSNAEYVFSHDESGQFQTYWSVWKVLPKQNKKAKRGIK